MFYKNIETEICKILRKNTRVRFHLKVIEICVLKICKYNTITMFSTKLYKILPFSKR